MQQTGTIDLIDALGPEDPYRARRRVSITDVADRPVAELSMLPSISAQRAMTALRRSRPLPAEDRLGALRRAGTIFATEALAGQTAEEYALAVSRVSGLPISVIQAATRTATDRMHRIGDTVLAAQPRAAVMDWRDGAKGTGQTVWTRRGEVLSVHASGVHPGAHSLWPEALALGYRVAVRPSRREPYTARRMVLALRAAGFAPDHVMLLPTEHDAGALVLQEADVAYGGDDVVRRYAGDRKILQQRPGRSKILITAEMGWRRHLDMIVDSISHHAGTGCVNTTAVLLEGDPTPLAEAVAERLSGLPSLPPEDAKAVLPVQSVAAARALERFLHSKAAGARAHLGGDGIVDELPSGGAVLRPAVYQLDRPDAPQAGVELAFPCVWIAPWRPTDGIAPLRDTLTLTALTRDEELINALLVEPGISNLHLGDHPTYWTRPGLPHDGYLADFLMRTKTLVRD